MTYTITEGPQGIITIDTQGPGGGIIMTQPLTLLQGSINTSGGEIIAGGASSLAGPLWVANGPSKFQGGLLSSAGTASITLANFQSGFQTAPGQTGSIATLVSTNSITTVQASLGALNVVNTSNLQNITSVGTSSLAALSVSTAINLYAGVNASNVINVNNHIIAQGVSTVAGGTGVVATSAGGVNATITGMDSINDTCGTLFWQEVGTPAVGPQLRIMFANAFTNAPRVFLTPAGPSTAAVSQYAIASTNSFTLQASIATGVGVSQGTFYHVFG